MSKDIKWYIKNCDVYEKIKMWRDKIKGLLKLLSLLN